MIFKGREKSFKWLSKAPGQVWYSDCPKKPNQTQPTNGSKCCCASDKRDSAAIHHSKIPACRPKDAEWEPVKKKSRRNPKLLQKKICGQLQAPSSGQEAAHCLILHSWDSSVGTMMGTAWVSRSPVGWPPHPSPARGDSCLPVPWFFEGGGNLQGGREEWVEGAISDLGSCQIKAQIDPGSVNSGHCYIRLFICFQRARHMVYLDLDV